MRGIWHLSIALGIFIALWLILEEITITSIFIPIALSLFPDVDFKFNSHRNVVFHNTILWGVLWVYNPTIITALSCLSIGIHLFLDITYNPKKWKGFYTVKIWGFKEFFWFSPDFDGDLSTIWYFFNFLISLTIFIIQIWFPWVIYWA